MTVGGFFMKGKAILRSLLLAYGVTGLFLLILAFLLFQFGFGGGTAAVGIIIIYVVSCLAGGFMAGKIIRKDRYIWGIVTAFLLCSAASGIFSGTGEMGYDLCPCVDYFFYVSWWRSHWWDAVVKAYKKML